jgi:hypothetical protein
MASHGGSSARTRCCPARGSIPRTRAARSRATHCSASRLVSKVLLATFVRPLLRRARNRPLGRSCTLVTGVAGAEPTRRGRSLKLVIGGRCPVSAKVFVGVTLLLATGGCAPTSEESRQSGDCFTPITFQGTRYDGYIETDGVRPGRELGTAVGDPCEDADPSASSPKWTVYAVPGVPVSEALLLKTHGGVVVRTAMGLPRVAADPDLKRLWPGAGS